MENLDKGEVHTREVKNDLNLESKKDILHESGVVKLEHLTNLSEDFLKHEGGMEKEFKQNDDNYNHPSISHELNSVSSKNLINFEYTPSSSAVSVEGLPTSKNIDDPEVKDETLASKDDGVTNVDNNGELKEKLRCDYEKQSKGDEEDSAALKTIPEHGIKLEVSASHEGVNRDLPSEIVGNPISEATIEEPVETDKEPTEEWMDILGSGHLMKKVLKPGIPNTRPQKSDICVLNLIGRLEDGTVVEQSENLEINHSDNEVIQGLDFALALMDKGEEAEIKVTPRFGYGSLGKRPEIPPGANLIYTVTLLDIKEEPQIHTLNVSERIRIGLKKKERGNWWYSRDENTLAINCYRRALDYLDDTEIPEPHSEKDIHKLLEERLKTYNNLGASQMKISAFDAALMSVNNVLAAQPENVKALFRKAKILKEKGELQESINVVKLALSHEPESQTLQQELSLLMAAQRKVNSKQRELYKKMMGNSNNQNDEDKKNSKSNYKTFTLVAAVSFAVAVLGTIVVKYKF